MAIYRPQRRRWALAGATGLAGLLLGVLLGWGVLRPAPDPVAAIEEVRTALAQAGGSLEIVAIEYSESVEGGEVVTRPEYEGARDALASSRDRYAEVRDAVEAISPDLAAEIDRGYAELQRLVDQPAPSEEVSALAEELRETLTGALGG